MDLRERFGWFDVDRALSVVGLGWLGLMPWVVGWAWFSGQRQPAGLIPVMVSVMAYAAVAIYQHKGEALFVLIVSALLTAACWALALAPVTPSTDALISVAVAETERQGQELLPHVVWVPASGLAVAWSWLCLRALLRAVRTRPHRWSFQDVIGYGERRR